MFALAIVLMVLLLSLTIYGALPEEPAIGLPKEAYQKAAERWSGEVVSRYELERPHRLTWGLLYAVDFFGQKDGKVVERAEDNAKRLAPAFSYRQSEITREYTVEDENRKPHRVRSAEQVKLLDRADTFRGTYRYRYRWVTRREGDVTVTEEVLAGIDYSPDWSRFDALLKERAGVAEVQDADRQAVLQAGVAFTSGREHLAWLALPAGMDLGAGLAAPAELMPVFEAAGSLYSVPWYLLAAIARVESNFNPYAVGPPNYTGELALGMMQFLPSTWRAYGVDADSDGVADPFSPVDAVYTAARYLQAHGVNEDVRKALWAYNHSWEYVDTVLAIAEGYRSGVDYLRLFQEAGLRVFP